MYLCLKIAGKPGWWLLLMLIRWLNVSFGSITLLDTGKAFGQSTALTCFCL